MSRIKFEIGYNGIERTNLDDRRDTLARKSRYILENRLVLEDPIEIKLIRLLAYLFVAMQYPLGIKDDQISIDYENESVRDGTYTFSLEKDKLTLIGGEGTVGGTYTLTRVEE